MHGTCAATSKKGHDFLVHLSVIYAYTGAKTVLNGVGRRSEGGRGGGWDESGSDLALTHFASAAACFLS